MPAFDNLTASRPVGPDEFVCSCCATIRKGGTLCHHCKIICDDHCESRGGTSGCCMRVPALEAAGYRSGGVAGMVDAVLAADAADAQREKGPTVAPDEPVRHERLTAEAGPVEHGRMCCDCREGGEPAGRCPTCQGTSEDILGRLARRAQSINLELTSLRDQTLKLLGDSTVDQFAATRAHTYTSVAQGLAWQAVCSLDIGLADRICAERERQLAEVSP